MAEYLMSEIQVPGVGDPVMIIKDKEARNDLSTAVVKTSASNPLTFTTRSAQNAQSAEIVLEPIQDLHGYDHPWPAGGGKNLLPMTVDGIKTSSRNANISWNGNVGTVYGVTITLHTDDGISVSKISVSGTPTNTIYFCVGTFNLKSGVSYVLNGCPSNKPESGVLYVSSQPSGFGSWVDSGSGATYNATQDWNDILFYIRIWTGVAQNNDWYPMIRLATETDPTFVPYSNYCPITGHTEVSVGGCGKNLYDKEHLYDGVYDRTGNLLFGSNYKHSMTPCKESQVYSLYRSNRTFGGYIAALLTSDKVFISIIIGNGQYNQTFTTPLNAAYIAVQTSESDDIINEMLVEGTDIFTHYEPYTPSNDLTIQFGEKVYGATVELKSGTVTVDIVEVDLKDLTFTYDSTNARFQANLPYATEGKWIDYAICSCYKKNSTNVVDKTFNIGWGRLVIQDSSYNGDVTAFTAAMQDAQVAYATTQINTITLTPNEISLLSGANTIWTDGTSIKVAYRDGKVATLADLQENETMEDETTQLLYKLGVNNGLLFIEEV